jgi:hypothetical protein
MKSCIEKIKLTNVVHGSRWQLEASLLPTSHCTISSGPTPFHPNDSRFIHSCSSRAGAWTERGRRLARRLIAGEWGLPIWECSGLPWRWRATDLIFHLKGLRLLRLPAPLRLLALRLFPFPFRSYNSLEHSISQVPAAHSEFKSSPDRD